MTQHTLYIIALLTISFTGCEPAANSPSPDVGLPSGSSALRVIPAAQLPAGISRGWRYQTAAGQTGWQFDVPSRSKSANFPVRVRVESDQIISLRALNYNSTHGRAAARTPYTDLFTGRTKTALPVDAITGATSTSNAVNRAAQKALFAAAKLKQ